MSEGGPCEKRGCGNVSNPGFLLCTPHLQEWDWMDASEWDEWINTSCPEAQKPVQISMTWTEAAALHEALAKQWHKPRGVVHEFVTALGARLKERPKT